MAASSPSGTSAQAVRVLGDTLNQLSIGGRKVKADNLIRDLELVRQDLLNKIRAFERDRQDVAASCDRLMIINRVLSGDSSRFKATEYQNLKFQLNDAQSRLNKLREILSRHKEVSTRLSQLSTVEPFPSELKRPIEDLVERRLHKAEEIERIAARFTPLVKICKEYGTAMRIGTNHGSLSDRIMSRYGDTPLGMVESALEFLRICVDEGYYSIVLSMKASNPQVMVQAYRLLIAKMRAEFMDLNNMQNTLPALFPLHLTLFSSPRHV